MISLNAWGQDGFYASGLLGISSTFIDVNRDFKYYQDTLDPEITFGFRFGLVFNDHISAGIHLQRYTGSTTYQTVHSNLENSGFSGTSVFHKTNVTFNNFMAEFTYYVSEVDESSFWISGLLGVTQIKTSRFSDVIEENSGETSLGASLGYHFMVAPNFSISPQFSLIYIDINQGKYIQYSGLFNVTLWL